MNIFGVDFSIRWKGAGSGLSAITSATGGSIGSGWFGMLRETFSGAWQSGIEVDGPRDVLAFSAVFACVTIIASDIAKMRIKIVEETNGICSEIKTASPFLPVLAKPNRYQTRIKFVEQWIVSKLLYGNTYALKARDGRGIVTALYVLDATRVQPLVSPDGSVYYRLAADQLSGLDEAITVPASEIIHDTMVALWHPLVGVSPIYACGKSATMGNRIQSNSTKFFDNMSRPSGILTAPGAISDETANRLKLAWDSNYSGENIGRVAVVGDGLKYEAMSVGAADAQLIEQLKWTVDDVARCFHVPLFKLGGAPPAQITIESLNQTYYSDCLQALVEAMEACLDDGLSLPSGYYTEFALDGLLRMDTAARYKTKSDAVAAGWMSPNEARASENMLPVVGGESPMIQQQNYSLAALAKRDAREDPFASAPQPDANPALPVIPPEPVPASQPDVSKQMAQLSAVFIRGLEVAHV